MQKNKFKWQLINDSITDDDKKVWTVQEISRLNPWEYEKVEKEIDRAVREGRVVDSVE